MMLRGLSYLYNLITKWVGLGVCALQGNYVLREISRLFLEYIDLVISRIKNKEGNEDFS